MAAIAPGDVDGYLAYEALFGRIRRALRGDYTEATDTWLGPSPTRPELEARLGHDPELIEILFDTPIADVIERHVADERLRTALHGQGIIGTFAGPRDPGTAAVHALHSLGTLDGRPGAWGYVEGGMGRVSLGPGRGGHRGRRGDPDRRARRRHPARRLPGRGASKGGERHPDGRRRQQRRPQADAGAVPGGRRRPAGGVPGLRRQGRAHGGARARC